MTRRIDAQKDAPISVTWLFAPVFAAVTLLHLTLLRLPYFWDEGGYYIPAAWDFFRLGTVIPVTTVRNAHPPLPSVAMAAPVVCASASISVARAGSQTISRGSASSKKYANSASV